MTTATTPRRADMRPLTYFASNPQLKAIAKEYGDRLDILSQSECLQLLSVLAGYLSELAEDYVTDDNESLFDWGYHRTSLTLTGDVQELLGIFDDIEDPQHIADVLPAIADYSRCEDE